MNNAVDTIIAVVVFIGLLTPVLKPALALMKAHTRNKNLLFAENIAGQAVDIASKVAGLTGSERKKVAVNALSKRLSDNGLAQNFTADQVSQLVEKAYTELPKWWEALSTNVDDNDKNIVKSEFNNSVDDAKKIADSITDVLKNKEVH